MIKLKHKELKVWKLSLDLTVAIYDLTNSFPEYERLGLGYQLRRSAVSVASNIAEGSSRSSVKERKRFYEIACSSLVELDTQLEIAVRLNYFRDPKIDEMSDHLNYCFAMLSNLISKT